MSLLVRDRSRAWRVRRGDVVLADRFGPLHEPDSLLAWGSITKTVTSGIARVLADDGVLQLSDPVARFLPRSGLPEAVTIERLIDHEAALMSFPSPKIVGRVAQADPYATFTTEFFDERIVPALTALSSGRVGHHAYSNLGYAVLTRILEIVAGDSWWRLARDLVLTPLGVEGVSLDTSDPRVPTTHGWSGAARSHWSFASGPFAGVGGLLGTLTDLERYALETVRRSKQSPTPMERALIGWPHIRGTWWHNGQVRDQGAYVGVDDAANTVITVHTVGHLYGAADLTAARLQRRYARR